MATRVADLHTTSIVERFLDDAGEAGFIWARRQGCTPPTYHYLEPGSAHDVRDYTKAELECPADVCGDRRLTTVCQTRPGRRDHFRHFVKAAHPGESLNHIQSKALLLRWLAEAYPHVEAKDEVRAEDRVADILVANHQTGNRMAIEVQYSPLQNWHTRHDSYAAMGVVDQWIFGSHGRQAKRRQDDTVRLTGPQRALVREDLPLLWINPLTEQIATGYVLHAGKAVVPTAADEWVHLNVEPLGNCRLTALGIRTDTTRELHVAEDLEPLLVAADLMRQVQVPSREADYLVEALRLRGPDHDTGRAALRRLRELSVPGY